MTIPDLHPVRDDDGAPLPHGPRCAAETPVAGGPAVERPRPAAARRRWIIVAALATLVASALALWWQFRPAAAATPGDDVAVTPAAAPDGAGAFAELFVAAYLTGDVAQVEASMAPGALAASLTGRLAEVIVPHTRYVTRAGAVAATRSGDAYWSVIVAADVLEFDEGGQDGYVPAGLQHYSVSVYDGGGRYAAVSLPARVPRPSTPEPTGLALISGDATAQQRALAAGFFDALLAGRGEIGRFTTPDGPVDAIDPPPYRNVELLELHAATVGTARFARAVLVASGSGAPQPLEYTLELEHDGQVWLVAGLHSGPPLLPGGP